MVIRISALIVPIVLDFMYCLRDPVHDSHSIDFFNWLVEYRKTVCFNERYQKKFQTKEVCV